MANVEGKPADPYKAKNLEEGIPLKTKVEDLIKFIEKSKFCMMATRIASSGLIVSRCMALAGKEGDNSLDLIFHANSHSGKTNDLHSDPDINLAFLNNSGEWASISGRAAIVQDQEEVKKHYSPSLKAWMGDLGDGVHNGGPSDPRICLIKVHAVTAQYCTQKRNAISTAVEIAKGSVMGSVPDINHLRYLDEQEINQWRSVSTS